MRLFLKLCFLLFFALPLAVAGVIYLAVDTQPSINRAAEITPSNIERAKRILDQNDPRKLTPGARRTITVDQADIDLAANYLARQYFAGGARVQLKRHSVHIGASVRAPTPPIKPAGVASRPERQGQVTARPHPLRRRRHRHHRY